MLNPSTADAKQDDPTIRRCMGFARRWRYGGIVVVNLFAYRATHPCELLQACDPVGPDNDSALTLHTAGHRVIAAWGRYGRFQGRAGDVLRLLGGHVVECLGTTRQGHPRHPLYVPGSAFPVPYKPPETAALKS
jgi:hypothetical protein